ncbi:MAG: DUF177 domain-containing protein [Deltaproteobacteria bacterium]|nr:DUF177 domain-containing protein [Deltaproteobacteria bacterium]MDH4122041.1 DUF177 domain-containing protein [Deltaproteobacteria bacterium]
MKIPVAQIGVDPRTWQVKVNLALMARLVELTGPQPAAGMPGSQAEGTLTLWRRDDRIFAEGTVGAKPAALCDRCLAPLRVEVTDTLAVELIHEPGPAGHAKGNTKGEPSLGDHGRAEWKGGGVIGGRVDFEGGDSSGGLNVDLDGFEWTTGELEQVFFSGDTVDLDLLVEEQILLALPPQRHCREDCQGLCPRCGHNLNEGPCGCPAEDSHHPFAGLKDLLKPTE